MGNTRYHTKDNGQSYAELEYDIWGNPTSPNMLINNDNGVFIFATFTGHIYDTVLDIYFAEARFYDAKNRQWMNSDPMKDGLNWYQYVRSNPATWWDPSGLMSTEDQQRLQDFGRGVLAAVLENLSDQLDITGKMISDFANAFKVNTPEISSFSYYSNSTVPSADIRIFINSLERDSEYLDSYYLGKMVGDLGVMVAGGFIAASGVVEIIGGLGLGAGGTVAAPVTGGASILAYVPAVAAVVSGTVSVGVGLSIGFTAAGNLASDIPKYFENLNCEGKSGSVGNYNLRDDLLSKVKNERLKRIINELYRPGATIGDGGTADMLKHEFDSGKPLSHLQKAQDNIKAINKLLTEEVLTPSDRTLAYEMLNKLYDAVKYISH